MSEKELERFNKGNELKKVIDHIEWSKGIYKKLQGDDHEISIHNEFTRTNTHSFYCSARRDVGSDLMNRAIINLHEFLLKDLKQQFKSL